MHFSQRIGKKPVKTSLQTESMDSALRKGIWEAVDQTLLQSAYTQWAANRMSTRPFGSYQNFLNDLWVNHLGLSQDSLGKRFENVKQTLQKGILYDWQWYEVYDLIEYISKADLELNKKKFHRAINKILEEKASAYRLLGHEITPISGALELGSLQQTINALDQTALTSARLQFQRAISRFVNREGTDYPGVVQSALDALWQICLALSESPTSSLDDVLENLQVRFGVSPTVAGSIRLLFEIPSDGGSDTNNTIEDARLVLVQASAVMNYLLERADGLGTL